MAAACAASRRGSYEISLSAEDREVLRALPAQLRDAIAADPKDDAFRRLFPPAYANDPKAEQEYRRLVGPELDENRTLALETLAKTADATELTEERSWKPGCARSTTSACGWVHCWTSARTSRKTSRKTRRTCFTTP